MRIRALLTMLTIGLVVAEASAQEVVPIREVPADTSRAGAGVGMIPDTCLQMVSLQEQALVTGFARDSATGVVLPGARVSFTWDRGPELPVGELSTTTDGEGRYALCPVPTEVPIALSATFPSRRAEGTVTVPASRDFLRLDFDLTGQVPPESDRPSRVTLLSTGSAGETATVTGTVRDETSGAPLVGAQVIVPELGIGTVTEPGGRFRLDGVPPGDHTLRVEHLGYRPADAAISFEEPSDFTAVAWLVPQAVAVEALEVHAPAEADVEARRSGTSRYRVTRDEFEKRPSASITEILRAEVPGLRVLRDRRGCPVLETRRGEALIVVDGVPFRDGCILKEIDPTAIESVDVLSTVAASTRWGSLGGSGVVEITTRRQ